MGADVARPGGATSIHRLSPRPPIRSYAIAAAAAVLGAVLVVSAGMTAQPWLHVVGVVFMIIAVGLTVLALIMVARLSTTVIMDSVGVEIRRVGRRQRFAWAEVSTVKATRHHLIIVADPGGTEFVNPRGEDDPVLLALMTDFRDRLDADRGYGN